MPNPPILTVAAVIRDAAGRVLLVRKRDSQTFIQPGGKREPGEDSLATLARELVEELGVHLRVRAEVYLVEIDGEPVAQAEIAELAWIDPAAPHPVRVAELSARHILPRLRAVPPPA